jgi:hypothetical protein
MSVTITNNTNDISNNHEQNISKRINCEFNDLDPQTLIDISMDDDIKNENKRENKKLNKKTNNITITIPESFIINPFFTNINGGSVLSLAPRDLRLNYKHCNLLCFKDDIKQDDNYKNFVMCVFSNNTDKQKLVEACKYFTLIKAPITILRNYYLKKRANLVKSDVLTDFYPAKAEMPYDLDEIVIPLFELNETKARVLIHMYGNDHNEPISMNTFQKLHTMISIASYYNKFTSISSIVDSKIINIINALDEEIYWSNSKNCNFNMDDIFNMRSLSYNGHRLDQIRYATISGAKTLNNLLTKLDQKNKPFHTNRFLKGGCKNDNYIDTNNNNEEINIKSKYGLKSEHMNIYQVLLKSEKRTFYATDPDNSQSFTKDDVANLFEKITDEKYRFHLLNTLLISKEYCHLILNNKRVLQRNQDLFEKYKPLYAYLFGYAWVTFYLEESIFTTRSTKNHRFVFSLETAEQLPVFPFSMENIHHNPYVSLLLNRDLIHPMTNCMSINSMEDYKKYYGLCSKEEAFKRFNCFVSGNSEKNIFQGLDPKIFSFSGSVIPACLQRRSPLLDICTNNDMKFDDIYGTYFAHYYGESDIDVMCSVPSMAEFMLHCTKFLETITKNLECKRTDIKINAVKKMAVVITKHFFKVCVDDVNAELGTSYSPKTLIKIFEESLCSDNDSINKLPSEIITYFHVDYVQEKNEIIKKWRALQKVNNIEFDYDIFSTYNSITPSNEMVFKMASYDLAEENLPKKDHEVYYFINDFMDDDHQVPNDKNYLVFKFSESIRYKVESPKLKRTIELLKIETIDPFSTVGRFHKPCVRAYLQGDTFYMLPSFITAMMTLINIDYKYFAGSRDPIEIINKYMMRGYSVILNSNEKKSIIMYNKNIDITNGMFKIINDAQALGPKDLNDKIYKPGVYKLGLPSTIYKNSEHTYIKNVEDLKNLYQKSNNLKGLPIDILNYTAIGKNGNVTPLQTWVASAFYESINSI